ncbi:MAG: helix-turn-helix domain-containing protein [bacterium]|jgi:transcriptional regulator with XRE-family HTH domain
MNNKQQFTEVFGNNVRKVRTERRMTLEQLSLEAGLTYSQISRIELGKINTSAYTVYLLSKTLQVSPSELFSNNGEK